MQINARPAPARRPSLSDVLQAVDAGVREVLDATTLEDMVSGWPPSHLRRLLSEPPPVRQARETPAG